MEKAMVFATILLLCIVITKVVMGYFHGQEIEPLSYSITLDIDIEKEQFTGSVIINIRRTPGKYPFYSSYLIFNAEDLIVPEVYIYKVTPKGEKVLKPTKHVLQILDNTVFPLYYNDPNRILLKPNHKYVVQMTYKGNFSKDMRGLYASKSRLDNIKTVMTHFEPTSARRVFPCYDEPQFRSQFNISLIIDNNYLVISNLHGINYKKMSNYRKFVTLRTTPNIPTYQLAFVVYHKRLSNIRNHDFGSLIGSDETKMFLDVQTYLDSFTVTRPDLIIVPELPGIEGGSVSLGLILLTEEKVLVNNKSEIHKQQDAFLLLAKEYLQQWFGISIVLKLWNYVWLHKGLATYLQYDIVSNWATGKEWELNEYKTIFLLRDAVEFDTLETTRALSTKLIGNFDVNDSSIYFDELSYKKAAAVFFTLENMVGKPVFLKAVKQYYLEYKQTNIITPEHFWRKVEEIRRSKSEIECQRTTFLPYWQNGKHRSEYLVMDSWEYSRGVPVLNATRVYNDSVIELSQKRFTSSADYCSGTWYIPINFVIENDTEVYDFECLHAREVLEPSDPCPKMLGQKVDKTNKWFIINVQASYYYLVNYDKTNWMHLACALKADGFSGIHFLTRSKLLYDAFTLARHGELEYSVALEFVASLKDEEEYITFNTFFYVFDFFYSKFAGLTSFDYLQKYLANILDIKMRKLVGEDRHTIGVSHKTRDTLNKAQLIKWACLLGSATCRRAAKEAVDADNYFEIPKDLEYAIVCGGIIEVDSGYWERWKDHTNVNGERMSKFTGCIQNEFVLNEYVGRNLMQSKMVFKEIYRRGIFGVNYVINYFLINAIYVYKSVPKNVLTEIIIDIASYITTDEQLTKLGDFTSQIPGILQTVNPFAKADIQAEAIANRNIRWIKSHSDDITNWIKRNLINNTVLAPNACNCSDCQY